MSDNNTFNILYFESSSMRGLYDIMENWQHENRKRFLSVGIQKDGENFCCIALTNPMVVWIEGPFPLGVYMDEKPLPWKR